MVNKKLIEKYWAGETTVAEEKALKTYFNGPNVAKELAPYRDLFVYFDSERKTVAPFEVTNLMPQRRHQPTPTFQLKWLAWRRVAAAIICVIALGFLAKMYVQPKPPSDLEAYWASKEIKDPRLAYEKTKAALLLVSQKLNDGTQGAFQQVQKVQQVGKMIKSPD